MRRRLLLGVAGAVVVIALPAACTFERRADHDEANGGSAAADTVPGVVAEEPVMAAVEALHRALAMGDAARVARLTAPGAVLVDQEENVHWRADLEGAPLPTALDSTAAGLTWSRVQVRVTPVGEARLVVLRYRADIAGEAVPWSAVETLLFEPGADGGWRLRHLHRSRGQGEG